MKRTTLTISFFATLGVLGVIAACAPLQSANSGTSDSASRDPGTTQSTSTRPLAYCSHAGGSKVNLNIETYRDSSGTIRDDIVQGKLVAMTESFRNGTDYIRFFRWNTDSTGAMVLDSTPISLKVIAEVTGQVVSTSQDFLRWDMVSTFATNNNIAGSASDFFTRVRLIMDIRDPDAQYNALRMVYYDGSNTIQSTTDILIPVFAANPNDYATLSSGEARSTILRNIHPFAGNLGQTASYYQTQANAFCF